MPDAPMAETRPQHTVSSIALVASNVFPVLGVIFLGWPVSPVVMIYWIENLIVGGFNVLRMLVAHAPGDPDLAARAFYSLFFCVHFGGFCLVHGTFVFMVFGHSVTPPLPSQPPTPALVMTAIHQLGIGFAVLALCVSHGASLVVNYIRSAEYRRVSMWELFIQPYRRVVVLHLVIFASAIPVLVLHSPLLLTVAFIAVKTVVDLWAHRRERAALAGRAAPATPA